MRILAMDLAKSKTVVCDYDGQSGKHKYLTVRTKGQEIHDLIVDRSPDRVVFEISSAVGWVCDIVGALGIEVQVANPNHQGWRWKSIKRKSDRTDALKLAQLSAMNQLPKVHVPGPEVRQRRGLIQYRQRLVKRSTQIKNNIRAILEKAGYSLAKGKSGWTQASIEQLRRRSLVLGQCDADDLWRGQLAVELELMEAVGKCLADVTGKLDKLAQSDQQVNLLRTIPGVGARLAEAVAAFLDEPARFGSGKQVGCYVGLTPRQYQSGSMDRQGRISGCGNRLLRALLVEVSWMGLRHNQWMRQTYQHLLRGSPSRKKIAITAVARKLLVRCWAMLRDGTAWCDPVLQQPA